MRILIASGIYPPDIGGPAQYARNLYEVWKGATDEKGNPQNEVKVAAYRWERAFPPFVRHILYFLKIIRKGWNADLILVLDTWSAAVPAMAACKLMRKKYIIRTGGDFLWETYVERTQDLVLLRDFYKTRMQKLSSKEKLVFKLSGAAMRNASALVFSTIWQKNIFEPVYKLDSKKSYIVENYCGKRLEPIEPENRSFVGATRTLHWKNIDLLKSAFELAKTKIKDAGLPAVDLDTGKAVYDSFVEKIHHSYAVILVSLGDISPNMIFDAIRAGVPFILTKETGIAERVKDCAIFVDPQNENEIAEKIMWLANPENRRKQAEKVRALNFQRSWNDIAKDITEVWAKTK